jgi:hypothetical protein
MANAAGDPGTDADAAESDPNEDDGSGADDESPASAMRADASATLKDCQKRWSTFRTSGGSVLEKYFDRTFDYFESILQDGGGAKTWFQDGVALLVGYYSGGHDLCQAMHDLYSSRPGSVPSGQPAQPKPPAPPSPPMGLKAPPARGAKRGQARQRATEGRRTRTTTATKPAEAKKGA